MWSGLEEWVLGKCSERFLPEGLLLDVRKQAGHPGHVRAGICPVSVATTRRKGIVGVVVLVESQPDLLHIVDACYPVRCLSNALNSRNRYGDKYSDNANDNQEFDQGKCRCACRPSHDFHPTLSLNDHFPPAGALN